MKISPAVVSSDPLLQQPQLPSANNQAGASSPFKKMLTEVSQVEQQADNQIQQALLGQGDLHEAMLSLEKASLGLKFLVQVRNKLLQAYDDLSRMSM